MNILTQLLDGVKMTRTCKISKGKLPEGREFKVDLTCDFTGCTVGKALLTFAMPDRGIAFAGKARTTMSVETLKKLEKTGYTVMAVDVAKEYIDPEEAMKKQFPTMTFDQQVNFLRGLGVMDAEKYTTAKDLRIIEPGPDETKTIEEVRDDVKKVETKLRKA